MSDAPALAQGEIFTGALPGVVPARRRRATVEMKRAAAEKIVADILSCSDFQARDRDGIIEDLVSQGEQHMDGYDLAKKLESRCGWSPTANLVETLDTFGICIDHEIMDAQRQWAAAYDIKPSLPMGSRVSVPDGFNRKNGTITGVYGHSSYPASYMVQLDGVSNNSRRIVDFEDCHLLTEAAAAPADNDS